MNTEDNAFLRSPTIKVRCIVHSHINLKEGQVYEARISKGYEWNYIIEDGNGEFFGYPIWDFEKVGEDE